MRVHTLQQFILSLQAPLQAAGANQKLLGELEAASRGLDRFGEMTIEEFAGFLHRAEEYERTGIVPTAPAKAAPKPRAKKAPAAPAMTRDEALELVRGLYGQSTAAEVNYSMLDQELKRLDALKKPDLDYVTSEFGLSKHKSKAAAIEAIRNKIDESRATHLRTQF